MLIRCLKCGAENSEATQTQACARCGAPVARQPPMAADPTAGAASKVAGWAAWAAVRASVEQQPSKSALDPEVDGAILAEWVEARKFATTRMRPGYDREEVDAFLEAIRETFLGIREPFLTPDDIRNSWFSTTRLRPGYEEEEVDEFLDEAGLRLAELTGSASAGPKPLPAGPVGKAIEPGLYADPADQAGLRYWTPGLPGPQYGEQLQDRPQGQAGVIEPELDTYGLPVRHRPARDRIQLSAIACLICGIVGAGLAAGKAAHPHLPGYLLDLAWLPSLAAAALWAALLDKKRKQLGVGTQGVIWAGFILAVIGILIQIRMNPSAFIG